MRCLSLPRSEPLVPCAFCLFPSVAAERPRLNAQSIEQSPGAAHVGFDLRLEGVHIGKPAFVPEPPPPVVIRPAYPALFGPLAALAERSGAAALLVLLGIALVAFGLGFVAGWFLE